MTLEQFEEYMNEVEEYAAAEVSYGGQPYACNCLHPWLEGCRDKYPPVVAFTEWFKPEEKIIGNAWMTDSLCSGEEDAANRINALFLFEQICISEKLYLEF